MRAFNSHRHDLGGVFGRMLIALAYVAPVAAYGAVLGEFLGA